MDGVRYFLSEYTRKLDAEYREEGNSDQGEWRLQLDPTEQQRHPEFVCCMARWTKRFVIRRQIRVRITSTLYIRHRYDQLVAKTYLQRLIDLHSAPRHASFEYFDCSHVLVRQ